MPRPSSMGWIRVIALCTLITAGGCSDDPAAPGPEPANVAVETANRDQETIGPDGGTLSTTSNAGITYTLVIPAGALPGEVAIAMTPVTSIQGLPYAGGIEGAVQLQPSGLNLLVPAILTIGATASPSRLQRLIGFLYEGDAAKFELSPGGQAGGEIRVLVSHFSGAGAALADPANLGDCEALGPNEPLVVVITTCVPAGDRDAFIALMQRYFDDVIEPAVQNGTGDGLQDAVRAYLQWRSIVDGGLAEVYDAGGTTAFATRVLAIELLIDDKITDGIAAAKAQCTPGDLQWLIDIFEFHALAVALNEGPRPDLENSILADLCATAIVESTELADPLPLNQDRSLDIDFALEVNGTPTDAVFAVTVTDPDNLVRTPSGRTDAQGRYTTVVRRLIEEGANFDIGATLILPLFGVSGLALTEVPITVQDQVFRGGNARITSNLPAVVAGDEPFAFTLAIDRLVQSGYQPVVGAQVSLAVTGGSANPAQATTDAAGIVEVNVTPSAGARTLVIQVTVSKDGDSLGSKRLEATIGDVVITLLDTTFRRVFAYAGTYQQCIDSRENQNDSAEPSGQLSASAEARCTNDEVSAAAFASMIQNSSVAIAPDARTAAMTFSMSGTGTCSTSNPARAGAEWNALSVLDLDFSLTGGSRQFTFSGELELDADVSVTVFMTGSYIPTGNASAAGGEFEVFRWDKNTGDGRPSSLLITGNLSPGARYRLYASADGGGSTGGIATGSFFLDASLTISDPVAANAGAGR